MANNEQFKKTAEDAAQQTRQKAGQLAHDNRDKLAGALGKLASVINDKTSHKYSDKISKATDAALKGADKLAEQRQDETSDAPHETPKSDGPHTDSPPTSSDD